MRICLVSQEYPPETAHGGIGSQTYLKAHGLTALGHEVIVISHSIDHREHSVQDQGVCVIRIPEDGTFHPETEPARWLSYSFQVARALAKVHSETPLDLIDFPEWGSEGYAFFLNRTAWNKIPAVIQLHGPLVMFGHQMGWPEPDSEFFRTGTMMEGTCVRLADAVFSSSACSADWCARHYGIDRNKIEILHLGVDTEIFRPLEIPKDERPTIIFVGKITPAKGAGLLVQAACRLAAEFPGLRLRLLGRGSADYMKELESFARNAGCPDIVEMAGFVNREELPRHLSRAHIFAAPSVYEGGPGFVYLEAMACGLPVIACEGSGVMEIIQEGETGFLVPPENPEALTRVLRKLLADPAQQKRMGDNARQFVAAHASSRILAKRLEAFYFSVIRQKLHTA